MFDNLQGETGDRGPFGNQGPRGYPVSLSTKEYSVLINNGNVCCISVYLRHLFFWKMRPEAPYVINIFFRNKISQTPHSYLFFPIINIYILYLIILRDVLLGRG